MECNGCGNDAAYRVRAYEDGREICDRCGSMPSVQNPDVYFRGAYLDPHLIDTTKPEQKNGVWIESRAQKARLLKEQGLREIGDRQHGARPFERTAWKNFKETHPARIDVRE